MTAGISSPAASAGADGSSSQAAAPTATVDKTMFLKLLVAQMKNQDPLNPADSAQFLTQLAQFQQLEQGVNMGEDISAIRGIVETLKPA